jgi:hypothetical protein
MRWLVKGAVVAVVLLAWLCPAPAAAQGGNIRTPFTGARRPMQLDIHGGFTHLGLGPTAGVRFGIPIVQNGFVRSINNAVYINFGADFYWMKHKKDAYAPGLGIPVMLHWEFFFTPRWSAFAELGANLFFHPKFFKGDGWHWSPGHWIVGAVGGRFHFNSVVALVLRLGNPYSAFGVTFMF